MSSMKYLTQINGYSMIIKIVLLRSGRLMLKNNAFVFLKDRLN